MRTKYLIVSITEFKAGCLGLLREMEHSGRPIIVTRNKLPVAMISPPHQYTFADRKHIFGSMKSSMKIKGDLLAPADVKWDVLA